MFLRNTKTKSTTEDEKQDMLHGDREGLYRMTDIKIRLDKKTGAMCLFTVEQKTANDEKHKIIVKETNVKAPNNVIRWLGSPKPGGRGWARNYLNKEDYERYGLIYPRIDIFEEVGEEYDEDRLYTSEELENFIDRVNQQRRKKREVDFGEGEQK